MGNGVDIVPSPQLGRHQPPRSERAEASVLGSEPTYLLHCLSRPPSWSTEKKAERMVGEQPQSRDYCPGTSFSGRRVRIPAGRWSWGLAPAAF